MSREQIKTLLVNITTAAIAIGVLVVGYFVFLKKETPVVDSVPSIAAIVEETASIGAEIDETVSGLGDLERAVAGATIIFDMPAFKNLQNFSVEIPVEATGRPNPFVPTAWKLKMKTLE